MIEQQHNNTLGNRGYTSRLTLAAALLALFCFTAACSQTEDGGGDGTINPGGNEPTPMEVTFPAYFGNPVNFDDNPLTEEGFQLGRHLFYEKKLSGNNTQSCASCHGQNTGFADPRRVSVGIDGIEGTVNAPALANLAWDNKFFWDGRANSLEEQSLGPIENPIELHETLENVIAKLEADPLYPPMFEAAFGTEAITEDRIAMAIAQFERAMVSADSKYDKFLRGEVQFTQQEERGMNLFFTHPVPEQGLRGGNCGDCHLGPRVAGSNENFNGFFNIGLEAEQNLDAGLQAVTGEARDLGKFKAVSLRNIAVTAPYMHDGRFETLEQVLDHYNVGVRRSSTLSRLIIEASNNPIQPGQPIRLGLTPQEKEDIIAFLHTMTDETFLNNSNFSDPFN